MTSQPTVTTATLPLSTGARIPQVGLGVWQTPRGESTAKAVRAALAGGYRHVDTAKIYGNEEDVGAAVRDSGVPRRQHSIVVEAYSPLARGQRLGHPVVVALAKAIRRSPAQVLLRWGIQKGVVVLPKSVHPKRIAENGAVFDFHLDEQAINELDALEEGLVTGWNPETQA